MSRGPTIGYNPKSGLTPDPQVRQFSLGHVTGGHGMPGRAGPSDAAASPALVAAGGGGGGGGGDGGRSWPAQRGWGGTSRWEPGGAGD